MRVLHVSPCFAPAYDLGGPVRSLEGLIRGLHERGDAEVRVLTTDGHGPNRLDVGAGWQRWHGVSVRYVPRWLRPDVTPRLSVDAWREAAWADVLHVTGLFCVPTIQGIVAAAQRGKPVVLSPRGALEPHALSLRHTRRKSLWLAALRPLLRRVTVFHATAEPERDSIRRLLPDAVVRIVPNGADVPTVAEADAARAGAGAAGPPVVGALGRIHPVKGLERLIGAAALLRDRGVALRLRVVGPGADGAYAQQLRGEMTRQRIDGSIEPAVDGLAKVECLARSRVLALPSLTENFGNVVVEALACGTPVVASRATPWAALEEARCGAWVEGDPTALADALQPYLLDAARARADGARGRALVEARYTWPAVAQGMLGVYEEALGLRP